MRLRWHRDPWVAIFMLVGVAACASVVFAGRYLPYQDWAGHVGLSAVLAYGDATGADVYLTRSLIPTPYYLFYVTTACLGALVPIEVAAKVTLLFATAVATIGAARLAQATDRSPRLCGPAPLLLFGVPLSLGFASFVTGLPWLLHALADTENLVVGNGSRRAAAGRLAVFLVLCFLGHGLVFVFAGLLIAIRVLLYAIRGPQRQAILAWVGISFVPVVLVAVPSVVRRLQHRYISPEFVTAKGTAWAGWVSWSQRMKSWPVDLLDRGGDGHGWTMAMLAMFGLVLLARTAWRRRAAEQPGPAERPGKTDGLPIYAAAMLFIFVAGPAWIGWPVTFWVVNQRAGTMAGLLLLMLPNPDLRGRVGTVIATLVLIPVIHNAMINRPLIERYSRWAGAYDEVRFMIPAGKRVVALNRGVPVKPGDTLYFYHLVDGAAYVPIGNIPEEVPVHRRNVPGTPYNPSAGSFDPKVHGRMYDYVVVHGRSLRRRVATSTITHRAVGTVNRWTVFETLDPMPRSQIRW